MACNDSKKFKTSEESSKASLRTKGAIDENMNILKLDLFNRLNSEWSNSAKIRFNISENLFSERNMVAIPNSKAFEMIDEYKSIQSSLELSQSQNNKEVIKPGVPELFESNPELANKIYEALGYNISNIDLKINRIGNRINIVTSSSNNKAQIDINIEDKNAYVTNTFVEKGQQGFGTLSYIKLANELFTQGLTLTSDLNGVDLQESGKVLWESLVSKNLAFYNPNIGRYVFSGQQAQQLYSQYLDIIFPESKVKDIVYHDGGHGKIKTEGFRKDLIGISDGGVLGNGFYFYFDRTKKYSETRSHTESVLLNVKNVSTKAEILRLANLENGLGQYEKALSKLSGITVDSKIKGTHGKYIGNYADALEKIGIDAVKGKYGTGEEIVVFEPEQIHILGTKQDIEGFRNFVNSNSYYQKNEQPSSKLNEVSLNKVKELINKMGISLMSLSDYLKKTDIKVSGINALADLTRNIIAIAEGKEHESLTEEMVHIATAIIEQVEPKLITEMISKIDRFKIYKTTFELYKNDKNYQLENGKPDIRKIKKEAVDKLISEILINKLNGNVSSLESLEENEVSFFRKVWNSIIDFFSSRYKLANIDIFEEVSEKILNENLSVNNVNLENGMYFQIEKNEKVDEVYNSFKQMNDDMVLNKATDTKKRHYTYKGKEVNRTVTEKDKEDEEFWKNHPNRERFDSMKNWGISGHDFIEKYLKSSILDENGYVREKPLDIEIVTDLPEAVQSSLKSYIKELVSTYKPGTRFLVENKVVNTKVKGLLGSTIDFIAIEPDDKTGVKVDKLDWKFTTIDSEKYEDLAWPKIESYNKQMGEYDSISYNLGLKRNQLRKSRMIPFIVNYKSKTANDKKGPVIIKSIEIGNVDPKKENSIYLLPISVKEEPTGFDSLDQLLISLNLVYTNLRKQKFSFSNKLSKNYKLSQLNKAIKRLHVSFDFKPLIDVMSTFIKDSAKLYKSLENVDFDKLTKEETLDKLRQIIEFIDSASKLTDVDKVYIDIYKTSISEDDRNNVLKPIENNSAIISRSIDKFKALQEAYIVHYAAKENYTKDDIVLPEKPITNTEYQLLEGSNLRSPSIRLVSKLILRTRGFIFKKANSLIDTYLEKLNKLEEVSKKLNKTPFELIGKVENGKLTFFKKLSPEFWIQYNEAKSKKDKSFFLKNVNIDEFKKYANELIEDTKKQLETAVLSSDSEENEKLKLNEIKKVIDNLNIESDKFKGYDSYNFDTIFRKSMITDNFLSEDYKKMRTIPEALEVWEFFRSLNEKARSLGYLKNQGNSFMPLIEASFIDKLTQSSSSIGVIKDFYNDLYKINPNEENKYAKFDESTQTVRKAIPKLFTRTNKSVEMLSKDLNKVGLLWIQALIEYEEKQNLEPIVQTILSINKNKGEYAVNPSTNQLIYKNGMAVVDKNSSRNADFLEKIADDFLYNLGEDENSLGNLGISRTVDKISPNANEKEKNEKKVSVKKSLNTLTTLTQHLALGLRTLVAIPNVFGVNFQAFINSGDRYSFSEYLKNEVKLIGDSTGMPTLSTIEKLVLDKFLSTSEGLFSEKQRQEAIKNGKYVQWISNWNFSDVMMSTNSFPERKLQLTNALSILQNTMIIDGNLVNIREYVTKEDLKKYKLSYEERKKLESTKEKRIEELVKTKSIINLAKIENDKLVLPEILDVSFVDYRTSMMEYARNLNGQINYDNKAGYRRDTMFKSFLMFKSWIPKQVYVRTTDLDKDIMTGNWKYGRSRLMAKVIVENGTKSISTIRNLLLANDQGISYMNDMLERKKEAYRIKYNKDLEITDEEFYEMVRFEIKNQVKELALLLTLLAMFLFVKSMEPDDEDDVYAINNYKYWAKLSNKILDELMFYYDPTSIQSVTSGSIVPQIGVLVNAQKFLSSLMKEVVGRSIGDQELVEDNHPTKYFLNIVPAGPFVSREIIPLVDPELAKDLGIRTTDQPRIMR